MNKLLMTNSRARGARRGAAALAALLAAVALLLGAPVPALATTITSVSKSTSSVTSNDSRYTWNGISESSTINLDTIYLGKPDYVRLGSTSSASKLAGSSNRGSSGDTFVYRKSTSWWRYYNGEFDESTTDYEWILAVLVGGSDDDDVAYVYWENVGTDADGDAVDLRIKISNISLNTYSSVSGTTYVSLLSAKEGGSVLVGFNKYNNTKNPLTTGSNAVYSVDFYKHGTSTSATGMLLMNVNELGSSNERIRIASSTSGYNLGAGGSATCASYVYSSTNLAVSTVTVSKDTYTGTGSETYTSSNDYDDAVTWTAYGGSARFVYRGSGSTTARLFKRFYTIHTITYGSGGSAALYENAGISDSLGSSYTTVSSGTETTVYWKCAMGYRITPSTGYKTATFTDNSTSKSAYVGKTSGFDYDWDGALITAVHTVAVTFTPITYYIAFAANGGSGSMSTLACTYGTSYTLTSNAFTRTGYTFTGWNTASGGGGTSYSDGASVKNLSTTQGATVTLYAQWSAITYYIAFSSNGGSGSMSKLTCTYGTSYTLTANAYSRTGYTFTGWNTASGGSGTPYSDGASVKNLSATQGATVTLYAQWSINTYTVKYSTTGAANSISSQTWTVASSSASIKSGSSLYRFNYVFDHWETSSGVTVAAGTALSYSLFSAYADSDGVLTLYAVWTAADNSIDIDDGWFYLTLYPGEGALVENLPAGTAFEVYEYYGGMVQLDGASAEGGWYLVATSDEDGTNTVSGTIEPLATALAEFTNSLEPDDPDAATFTPYVFKALDGDAVGSGSGFSFTISGDGIATQTVSLSASGKAVFDTIEYDKDDLTGSSGTAHTYTITEVVPDDAVNDAVDDGQTTYAEASSAEQALAGWTYEGIEYDTTAVTVAVLVVYDENGNLAVQGGFSDADGTPCYYRYGDEVCTSAPTFENKTSDEPEYGTLQICKVITEGAELTDQVFTVEVAWSDGTAVECITLEAANDWTWESAEHEAGTVYTVTEVDIPEGYSLVTSESSSLTGSIQGGAMSEERIANRYDASGSFAVRATKTMAVEGLTGGEFSFKLTDLSTGTVVATAVNDADGDVLFGAIELTSAGTYRYELSEIEGADGDVVYDTRVYFVSVVAVDDGAGNLECTVAYREDDEEGELVCETDASGTVIEGALPAFENAMQPGSLAITKTVEHATAATAGQEFEFLVELASPDGEELAGAYAYTVVDAEGGEQYSGTIASGGTITLADGETATIEELPHGTVYRVTELMDELPEGCYALTSITGDTEYGTDLEGGVSAGVICYGETSTASFTNAYEAFGTWTPDVTKILTGGIDLEEGVFAFELYEVAEDGTEVLIGTATNAAGSWTGETLDTSELTDAEDSRYSGSATGTLTFSIEQPNGTLSDCVLYDEVDDGCTYTYRIYELVDDDDEDITYDEHAEEGIEVEVSVADNGDGTLSVTATYDGEGAGFFQNAYDHLLELAETGGFGVAAVVAAGATVALVAAGRAARRRGLL